MNNNNLVSIIIPCYNQVHFLPEALQSVLDQTYNHWECVIVDDGSPDNTEEIAANWIKKDSRFYYYKKKNEGVGTARNLGIQKAKGNFIQFLDADDVIALDKIAVSIAAIEQHKVDVVCTNYLMFDGNLTNTKAVFSELAAFDFTFYNLARYWNDGFTIPIHCWFFKADLFDAVMFPEGLTAQEDWIVWLRIFQKSPKTFYIDKQLAFYRLNPKGRTQIKGFFNDTLKAIQYLKGFLNDGEFQLLYESAIIRNNNGMLYWRKREVNLKKSNTYQFGLLCKKAIKKIGLLPLAKTVFVYLNPLK